MVDRDVGQVVADEDHCMGVAAPLAHRHEHLALDDAGHAEHDILRGEEDKRKLEITAIHGEELQDAEHEEHLHRDKAQHVAEDLPDFEESTVDDRVER